MILSIEDIKSGKHDNEVRNRAKVFCSNHPTEETRVFCTDCNTSICHYCEGHNRHGHISIRDAIFEKMTDFESILADVHRKAEVLRAEIQHMKRLNEQLLTERNRCLQEINDVANDAHATVDLWIERTTHDLNSRYEHDVQISQEKQETMTAKDRQLRRCGDFISKIVQIGTPDEIICLQQARSSIEDLLVSCNQKIPPTANMYHLNMAERLMDVDLGTIEVIEPEGSVCSLLIDEPKVSIKRPDSTHSSSSDSGITEEPPVLPPKQERLAQPAPIKTHDTSSSIACEFLTPKETVHPKNTTVIKVDHSPDETLEQPKSTTTKSSTTSSEKPRHVILRNPSARMLLSIGRKGKVLVQLRLYAIFCHSFLVD